MVGNTLVGRSAYVGVRVRANRVPPAYREGSIEGVKMGDRSGGDFAWRLARGEMSDIFQQDAIVLTCKMSALIL